MADITPTVTLNSVSKFINKVSWETITEADQGGTATCHQGVKRGSVTFTGTFDGNWSLSGSVDGVNFAPLKDLSGNVITVTSTSSFEFRTTLSYFRVLVAGASSPSDVDVNVSYILEDYLYGSN